MKVFISFGFLFCIITFLAVLNRPAFHAQNLYHEIPEGKKEIPKEILSILKQPFTFLGKGAQVYAFSSQDGKYVLKLFRATHNKPRKFWRRFQRFFSSASQKTISREKWKLKFQETCQRNQIAFDQLRDETALIYLHFEQSPTPIFVIMNEKKNFRIDLSKLPFLIQKKAELVPKYFQKFADKNDHIEFLTAKNALKELFVKRAQKGFTDPRQVLQINYGFVDGKPIQIDVGKIEPLQRSIEEEIQLIHANIDAWFARHFSDMCTEIILDK